MCGSMSEGACMLCSIDRAASQHEQKDESTVTFVSTQAGKKTANRLFDCRAYRRGWGASWGQGGRGGRILEQCCCLCSHICVYE